jgi:DNA-binding transcriptional MocR family regulator
LKQLFVAGRTVVHRFEEPLNMRPRPHFGHRPIVPDALAAAIRRHKPRLVYLTPAIHNPTTASMTAARRREIAGVIKGKRFDDRTPPGG